MGRGTTKRSRTDRTEKIECQENQIIVNIIVSLKMDKSGYNVVDV